MATGMRSTRRQPGRRVEHEPFPSAPLKDIATMARAINDRGGRCRFDELAAALGQTSKNSGAFRLKTAAARMFGAVRTEGSELVLTGLGRRMASPRTEGEALVEAFLGVRLYGSLFDRYAADGNKLPANDVIEDDMIRLDVPTNNAQKARQVFLRSAEDAGFFRAGRDRLIRPSAGSGSIATRLDGIPEPSEPATPTHAEAVPMAEHPLMQGLVAKLPPDGERFTPKQRQRWLDAARVFLDLMYAGDDDEPDPLPSNLNGAATAQQQPSWQSHSAVRE